MTSTEHRPAARPPQGAALGVASVAVVVCAYSNQRWDQLCAAVQSVLDQRPSADQILVVVDHNDTLHQRAVQQFGQRGVTVLPNTFARGLSGARNTGVRAATAEVVAFLDDDASAEPGWSAAMVSHYREPEVAVVGGHAAPRWARTRPRWMPEEFDWVIGCSYRGQPTAVASIRNPLGCNMSIRRDVFDRIDGFDSAMGRVGGTPAGCEETELCIRIRQHNPGAQIIYDPGMRVRHRVAPERSTVRYFASRCYHEGRSKAVMSRLVGVRDGLSSERSYIRSVLPTAVARGLRRPRRGGIQRAVAVIAGLTVTAAGYTYGRLLAACDGARR